MISPTCLQDSIGSKDKLCYCVSSFGTNMASRSFTGKGIRKRLRVFLPVKRMKILLRLKHPLLTVPRLRPNRQPKHSRHVSPLLSPKAPKPLLRPMPQRHRNYPKQLPKSHRYQKTNPSPLQNGLPLAKQRKKIVRLLTVLLLHLAPLPMKGQNNLRQKPSSIKMMRD